MIQIQNLSKTFNNCKVLDNVSITIPNGHIYGIIGENGVGKSTLLQCLAGIYTVDSGTILIDNEPVYENNKIKSQIGYVADRNQFFNHYTVLQMLNFFKQVYPKFNTERFNKLNAVFNLDLSTKVKNLSKGMQMRLSIMLNLSIMPKVLILDEPTSGLDAIAKKQVLGFIIDQVQETGMSVVISSHHLSELEMLCDEVTMLLGGKVIYQDSVSDLKERVKKLQVAFKYEIPSDLSSWEDVLQVDHIGSVYYIITDHYSQALEERLKASGALFVESIALNLEEIFIYTAHSKEVN